MRARSVSALGTGRGATDRLAPAGDDDCAGASGVVTDAPSHPAASAVANINPIDLVVRVTAITNL
jgi:hypothetical protein